MKQLLSITIMLSALLGSTAFGQGVYQFTGQQVIPPSPNAAALVRYTNIPTNQYTGTAGVNVPLYNLTGRHGFNLSINLSYHAGGIKVQDVASSAGLGWSLNSGGLITRMVKHKPDVEDVTCGDVNNNLSWNTYRASLDICDSEPDIYYFNFLGRQGRFFIDPISKEIYTIPYLDLDFQRDENDWVITDENGFKYYYGFEDEYIEYTTVYQMRDEELYVPDPTEYEEKFNYPSTWHLKKIVSPTRIELASYSYDSSNIEYEMFSTISYDIIYEDCATSNDKKHFFLNSKLETNQKYISKVETLHGYVDFSYQTGRKDLMGGLRLDMLTIRNANDQLIDKINFEYYYSDERIHYEDNLLGGAPQPCLNDFNCNRLILKSISSKGIKLREFEYNDSELLPPRNSPMLDHWGYSNAKFAKYADGSTNDFYHRGYHSAVPKLTLAELDIPLEGANKTPIFESAKAYSLSKVIFPTGGYQRLEYESHGANAGGLRIAEIWVYDGEEERLEREYLYGEKEVYNTPKYHHYLDTYSSSTECFLFYCQTDECDLKYVIRRSESLATLHDLNGTHVGYGKVTERFNDGSSIVTDFTNFSDHEDDEPTTFSMKIHKYDVLNGVVFNSSLDPDGLPFASKTSNAWERGLPEKIQYKKENGGLVKMVENDFDFSIPIRHSYAAYKVETNTNFDNNYGLYHVGRYLLRSKPINLRGSVLTVYDQDDDSKKAETSLTYTYNTNYISLIETESYSFQDNTEIKIRYQYPRDYYDPNNIPTSPEARGDAIIDLGEQHRLTIPIETIVMKKIGGSFKVIGGSLNTYRKHFYNITSIPYESFELRLNEPLESFDFSSLNTSDNYSLDFSEGYEKTVEYTFDYTSDNLKQVDMSNGLVEKFTWTNEALMESKSINPLISNFQEFYSHKPLIGVIQQTDLNGKTMKYEYDKHNRLKLVYDLDDNIIFRNSYNYGPYQESLNASFTVNKTGILVGESVNFSANTSAMTVGENRYFWDFGDGTVVEDNGFISHSYQQKGQFSAKLTIVNPEHETRQTSKTIKVVDPIMFSLCVDGPTSIDLCNINSPVYGACTTGTPSSIYFETNVISGGCLGAYDYQWSYKRPGSSAWYSFGLNNNRVLFSGGTYEGTFTIKCKVTDSCEITGEATRTINYYKSDDGCTAIVDPQH